MRGFLRSSPCTEPVGGDRLWIQEGHLGKVGTLKPSLLIPNTELFRYISIQLLDRFIPSGGGKMEIREVEVEGWARSCGE